MESTARSPGAEAATARQHGYVRQRTAVHRLVDDEDAARRRTVEALERRYGGDYRVTPHASTVGTLAQTASLRDARERVVLVLADEWMAGATTSSCSLLSATRTARLVDWRGWVTIPAPGRS